LGNGENCDCGRDGLGLVGFAAGAGEGGANEAERAFEQAKHALAHDDFDSAIARLDEAIRLEPKQAKFQGMRGVAWLRKGEFAKGTADLKAAMQLTPGDAAWIIRRRRRRSFRRKLCARSAAGARMLSDRRGWPSTKGRRAFCAIGGAEVCGEDFGELIDWDPSAPLHSDADIWRPATANMP